MRRARITDRRQFQGSPFDVPVRRFLPGPEQDTAVAVRCTRLAGSMTLGDPHDVGGRAVVELVYADGHLEPFEQFLAFHRSRQFEFGNSDGGSAALAANILGLILAPREAWRLHRDCHTAFVADVPRDGGAILMTDVRRWVETRWVAEQSDVTLMHEEAELRALAERYGGDGARGVGGADDGRATEDASVRVIVHCAECWGTTGVDIPAAVHPARLAALVRLAHTAETCAAWRSAVLYWPDGRMTVIRRSVPGESR